ncbi:MAG: hypothetical protein KatS3mg119_1837 [Rhodothalassiaceae bacterium]|nr:MAG: hypothetical protein KatS3mg119_1837 [Rhodothalassiaceae bacterium]
MRAEDGPAAVSRRRALGTIATAAAAALLAGCAGGRRGRGPGVMGAGWPYPTLTGARPLVIAHRGASGWRPEHTLASYRLAIGMGADFIEPDLVMTRDGVLVARHDIHLSGTTDVAERPEFADRRRRVGDREDWFVSDFTWAELSTLRTRQPFPGRDHAFDGKERIPRLDEILALVREAEAAGRRVGIYPEIKQRPFFLEEGLDPVPALAEELRRAGFTDPARLFLQAFEPETVRAMGEAIAAPLVQLVDAGPGPDGRLVPSVPLEEAARHAQVAGPSLALLLTPEGADTGYVARAHELGLAVHPWTLRDDRLPPGVTDARALYRAVFALGVDAVFTDFPDTAVAVIRDVARAATAGEERGMS